MPQTRSVRAALQGVSAALDDCGQPQLAEDVLRAAGSPDEQLVAFITSNELWGGAGSIADQAGMKAATRTESQRDLEAALIHLGQVQVQMGQLNPRTVGWVGVFERWGKSGI